MFAVLHAAKFSRRMLDVSIFYSTGAAARGVTPIGGLVYMCLPGSGSVCDILPGL